MEDDLFNMLRHGELSQPKKLVEMMAAMIANLELQMLKGLRAKVDRQISTLQKKRPPMYGELNPFKILDVDITATQEEVERAYREKSWQYHPDQNLGRDTHEDMVKVNAAYEAIKGFRGWK